MSHLKNSKPKKWWSAIKNLVGSSSKPVFNSVEVDGIILQRRELASNKRINNAFIAATKSLSEYEKIHIEESSVPYTISDITIESHLKKIQSNKAPGPDGIPNWILNTFSMELSEPVTIIFTPLLNRHRSQGSGKKRMLFQSQRQPQ